MSAIDGPDEHSNTEQQAERSKQYNSSESGFEYDPNFQPEREFVLMPLFRRIGAMMGLRRDIEPECVYEAGPSTPAQEPAVRSSEPQEEIVLPEMAIQYSEPLLPAETQILNESGLPDPSHQQEELSRDQEEENVLQLEPPTPQHASDNVVYESFAELQNDQPEPIASEEAQPEFAGPSDETADEPFVAAHSEVPEMESAPSLVEWPVTPQATSTPAVAARQRSSEEVRQLVAPLREAAVKITAIVAQAAEWLRAKEEEFLRSTEAMAAESKREQENLRSSSARVESRTEHSPMGMLEQDEVPAMQRELAWRERHDDSIGTREPLPAPIHFLAKPDRPLTPPPIPIWKRVNWAEEFTPKRVAVLGGFAMAVLLVVGISFARRPASSVLPEQQTGAIEPGGVTVTAHPVASPAPPRVLRKTAANERPSPMRQHRSPRASANDYDDGPDVVIHHFDTAKKPSPVKQTTVAGVRHYSDM